MFPAGGTHFPKTHRRLVSGREESNQEQREASAQFFSNDVQFNTTDTGCNAAVEVTGMGKRNLLSSGLIAQLKVATPAGDALSIPAGLKIVLGELVGEFTLPVNSTDIMLRSGARHNSSLPLGFQRGLGFGNLSRHQPHRADETAVLLIGGYEQRFELPPQSSIALTLRVKEGQTISGRRIGRSLEDCLYSTPPIGLSKGGNA